MPARRFPPPWSIEQLDACYVVRDHEWRSAAKLLTKDEARRIAANIAKLPGKTAVPKN